MGTRREFIYKMTAASAASLITFRDDTLSKVSRLISNEETNKFSTKADDETFWGNIQNAFDVERDFIHLNSGGVSSAPKVVINSLKEKIDYANRAPSFYMWRHQEPEIEKVREKLASFFGSDKEEIAITRNDSESLMNLQMGFDYEPGDEILTTTLDYPRMLTAFDQLERRHKVKIVKVDYPVPLIKHEDYIEPIINSINSKTKIILVSHVCFLTGQILPVKEISRAAHEKRIEVIVDGAHSFNHIPFKQSDLGCDYFGSSLHKWTYAPIGTGMLYVKIDLIGKIWPLMAAPAKMDQDIRKFEEIGTHPAANHNAILDALAFNEMLGIERKLKRLRYLNGIWIDRIKHYSNVKFHVDINNNQNFGALVCFGIDGIEPGKLAGYLFDKQKIYTIPIIMEKFSGIRITPNVFTTINEIDRFAGVLERIVKGELKVE